MNIEKKIANQGLRSWSGSRRKGRGRTDGRNGAGDGKGGARLARASKRGARAKVARLVRADEPPTRTFMLARPDGMPYIYVMRKINDSERALAEMVRDMPTSGDSWSVRRFVGTNDAGKAFLRIEFDSQLSSRSEEVAELHRLTKELQDRGLVASFHRWTITASLPAPAVDAWADFAA